ncbi:pilus assembly protein N-terminal domain-containing protein [Planctomicrobium sp.]|nr:pilus assembly protein N-terminal domain-containing protein [Planctomicrobium sp.]MDB4733028.1 pilus assembly protein N-terminal domain-containing protein [Planctomicrobium sp.]
MKVSRILTYIEGATSDVDRPNFIEKCLWKSAIESFHEDGSITFDGYYGTEFACLKRLGTIPIPGRSPCESSTRSELFSATVSVGIQQVQATYDARRALDSRIRAMPKSERKLDVIHNRSQLVITDKRVTRIAFSDPSIIDVVQFSSKELSILGTGLGTTDLWLWFEEEGREITEPLMYVVTTIRDPDLEDRRRIEYGRIERKLQLLYPNSKVYLIPMSRKIIVRGQAKDPAEAAMIMSVVRGEVVAQSDSLLGNDFANGGGGGNGFGNGLNDNFNNRNDRFSSLIVDELQVPGEFQVNVRVRIAELSRSQLRRLGVDWSVIFNEGATTISQTLTGGGGALTGIFEGGDINVMVDALASNGSARVVEDARLITLSGQSAAFLSGGEFAVPTVVGIGGAQGQQTSFRGFGTSIITTPTVIDDDLIRLTIVPELSSVSSGNSVGGIPGLNVRRVQTQVELREGQTIVLGGVFSRREAAEVTRIPFLGEIPHIGNYLFNAKQATEDENEILIIVTPEIVRPMDAGQTPPLPGWNVTHPDDIDLYKYNRIEGNPDLGYYQLLPYGNGQGHGQDVGYNFYNPAPASGQIAPHQINGQMQPQPNGQPQYQQQQMQQPIQQAPYGGQQNYIPPTPQQYGQPQGFQPTPAVGQNQGRNGQIQQTSGYRVNSQVPRRR